MNREREFAEGQNEKLSDPRITFLLGLALVLFLMNLLNAFLPAGSTHHEAVPGLAWGQSGLALQPELIDNHLDTDVMVVDFTPFFFKRIPINHASKEILTTIPGVGSVLAESIMNQREQTGFFTKPEDLLRVPGIGRKRMLWLLKHVSFEL